MNTIEQRQKELTHALSRALSASLLLADSLCSNNAQVFQILAGMTNSIKRIERTVEAGNASFWVATHNQAQLEKAAAQLAAMSEIIAQLYSLDLEPHKRMAITEYTADIV